MKVRFLLVFLILSIILFSSEKIRIVTTINPYFLAASELSCGLADVVNLIPQNASPHTYSPSPKDMLVLEKADVIIMNGLGLEEHLAEYLRQMKMSPVIISSILKIDSRNENINPHIWLSASNLIKAGSMITEAFKEKMPADSALFDSAFTEYSLRILSADSIIKGEREKYNEVSVVLFHNSFEYFCSDYEIKIAGVVERSPGREPTAKEMKELADIIKRDEINVIFTEPQLNSKPVDILAGELLIEKDVLDPLGTYYGEKSVDMLLLDNWRTIEKHMKAGN